MASALLIYHTYLKDQSWCVHTKEKLRNKEKHQTKFQMPTMETLNKGDYVLVQYKRKLSVVQYVGVIEKVGDNGYDEVEIKFLTRKPS